ncbi:MAG: hypothetical protein KIPDCIKN_02255 [Haliscomenobacter sp.]|jgi:hypothetical protein|nr:hypothetical protein [Haliscomenobacter sp.]
MKELLPLRVDYLEELQPETELEYMLLRDPEFTTGLGWGIPRYGHPEGEVYKHIREVLENVDLLQLAPKERQQLRLIAFAHDTFKYKEAKGYPRDWSRHHGVLARQFLEQYTSDQVVLEITELHDEAYYAWRMEFFHQNIFSGRLRIQHLLDRVGEHLQLYYLFFKCDTRTGDKNQAPLKWFEHHFEGIDVVDF